MNVQRMADMLNKYAETPRNNFWTYGLAKETLPLWANPANRELLSDDARDMVCFVESTLE